MVLTKLAKKISNIGKKLYSYGKRKKLELSTKKRRALFGIPSVTYAKLSNQDHNN